MCLGQEAAAGLHCAGGSNDVIQTGARGRQCAQTAGPSGYVDCIQNLAWN